MPSQLQEKWAGAVLGRMVGYSRCLEPILLLHYPPHLVEGLALVLVQTQDRRPVFEPFFGHLSLFLKTTGFTPEWRGPRSWIAVVQPGGGRVGRREALVMAGSWVFHSCLGQYVFWI